MDLKNKIIYFSDLDDTLFQTKRKCNNGIHIATTSVKQENTSFYTKEQKEFLDHILIDNNSLLIPITARTKDQFQRTLLYKENFTPIYANYYGGYVNYKGERCAAYDEIIRPTLNKAQKEVDHFISIIEKKIYTPLDTVNVDQYYHVINSVSNDELIYIKELFSTSDIKFDIYQNEKNITILPSIINKKNAVKFLCEILEPRLTIGLGDSISDIEFLNFCDFKIISKIGELNKKVNGKN
jgi:hydroxymethylpyrimidine pyrophosphatase-like HAD family hydrolase